MMTRNNDLLSPKEIIHTDPLTTLEQLLQPLFWRSGLQDGSTWSFCQFRTVRTIQHAAVLDMKSAKVADT